MKLPWAEIEELPFRVDVGSTYKEAVSSSVPAHVMCFTTDGRIVLNGVTFGGASSITINGVSYPFDYDNGSITLPMAGEGVDGMMLGEDKAKLDGIEAGAEVNVVKEVSEEDNEIHITTKDNVYKAVSTKWSKTTEETLQGLQNSITSNYLYFSTAIEQINSQISNIEDRYDRDHKTLVSNTERIAELENYKQQTENNRNDIQTIFQKIENIEQIETNKADIQNLYQEIAKINEKISQGGGEKLEELYDLLMLDKQ